MAKYNLKTIRKSVDCDILNESGDEYVVQFKNGVIKSVDKDRVHSLNEIDSAVLDRVKGAGERVLKYGKDIYDAVKSWFVETFKLGGFLFFNTSDRILSASSPVNTMVAASSLDFINIIPSDAVVELAEENDIEPIAVKNFDYEGEYSGALFGSVSDDMSESVKGERNVFDIMEGYTDKQINDMIELSAYAKGEKKKNENTKLFEDWSQSEILDTLESQFKALSGKYPEYKKENPLLIWGAPGVGKTAMIRQLVDKLKGEGFPNISFVSMNVAAMGPEDVTLPVTVDDDFVKKQGGVNKFLQKMLDRGVSMQKAVKDLPKSWLPVYDPNDAKSVADTKKEEEELKDYLNGIANGGKWDEKSKSFIGDDGGIIFLDEYSRMPQSVQNALMQLPTTRELGAQSLKLGSKWLIVAAANRPGDMPNNEGRNLVQMALAESTRFTPVNYVPDFETWCKWARETAEDGGQRILQEIIDFLSIKENRKYFYMANRRDKGDSTKLAKATPRSWENLSVALHNACVRNKATLKTLDDGIFLKLCNANVGASVTSTEGNYHMGPGEAFFNYIKSYSLNFDDNDAAGVWGDDLSKIELFKDLGNLSMDFKIKAFKDSILPTLIRTYPYKDKGGFINPALAMCLAKFIGEYAVENNAVDAAAFSQMIHAFFDKYQATYDKGNASFVDSYNQLYDNVYDYIQTNLNVDLGVE